MIGYDYLIEWEGWSLKKDFSWLRDDALACAELLQQFNDLNSGGGGGIDDNEQVVVRRKMSDGQIRDEFIRTEVEALETKQGRAITASEYDEIDGRSLLLCTKGTAQTVRKRRWSRLSK